MKRKLQRLLVCGLLCIAPPLLAAEVSPNAGAVEGSGTLKDNDGRSGTWSVKAVLKNGNFTGEATISHAGTVFTAPLKTGQSFVENGKCYFGVEKDRTRAAFGGPCTTDSISGRLDGFIPGTGVIVGEMTGKLTFGAAATARSAPKTGTVPTVKLTCAWWETRVTYNAGEMNSRELRPSNMAVLTLSPNGTYRTANTNGTYVREGDHIRLTSGAFKGAVGQLRPDRSGQPAVYFERDENKRPDGVHIVDPATTACTQARQ